MKNPLLPTLTLVVSSLTAVWAAVPGPPQDLTAVVNGNSVTLSWGAPSTGDVPTGYVVEASFSPSGPVIASLPLAATSLTVPNVPNGVYYVRVRSVNAEGASAPSGEAVVVVPGGGGGCASPPNAPGGVVGNVAGNLVTVTWAAPLGGCPPTAYVLQAGSSPGASNLVVANVGATTAISAPAPPGTYYVRVIAINAFGASAVSPEAVIVVGGANPGAGGQSLVGTWVGTIANYVPRPGTGVLSAFRLRLDVAPPAAGVATRVGLWQDNLGCTHSQIAAFTTAAGLPVISMESLRCADGDVSLTVRSMVGNVASGTCSRGASCTFTMVRQ